MRFVRVLGFLVVVGGVSSVSVFAERVEPKQAPAVSDQRHDEESPPTVDDFLADYDAAELELKKEVAKAMVEAGVTKNVKEGLRILDNHTTNG